MNSCFYIFTKLCISLVTRMESAASFSLKQSLSYKLHGATSESRCFVFSSLSPSQEGVTDFRALRAKFQNDSNLANKLVQPHKKPPKLVSGGNTVPSPLPLSKREVIILKPKEEPAHPASQPSVLTHRPRANLGCVEPMGHNEEQKGNVLENGLISPKKSPEKPLTSYCTDQQGSIQTSPEDPQLPNSFHHALQIWENALSRGEKASTTFPSQRAANLYVHPPHPEQWAMRAAASLGCSRMRPSGSKPTLDLPAQKKNALLQAPKGHRSSEEAATESVVATVFCQSGYCAPREHPQHQKGIVSCSLNNEHIYVHTNIQVYRSSESAGYSIWREQLI